MLLILCLFSVFNVFVPCISGYERRLIYSYIRTISIFLTDLLVSFFLDNLYQISYYFCA